MSSEISENILRKSKDHLANIYTRFPNNIIHLSYDKDLSELENFLFQLNDKHTQVKITQDNKTVERYGDTSLRAKSLIEKISETRKEEPEFTHKTWETEEDLLPYQNYKYSIKAEIEEGRAAVTKYDDFVPAHPFEVNIHGRAIPKESVERALGRKKQYLTKSGISIPTEKVQKILNKDEDGEYRILIGCFEKKSSLSGPEAAEIIEPLNQNLDVEMRGNLREFEDGEAEISSLSRPYSIKQIDLDINQLPVEYKNAVKQCQEEEYNLFSIQLDGRSSLTYRKISEMLEEDKHEIRERATVTATD